MPHNDFANKDYKPKAGPEKRSKHASKRLRSDTQRITPVSSDVLSSQLSRLSSYVDVLQGQGQIQKALSFLHTSPAMENWLRLCQGISTLDSPTQTVLNDAGIETPKVNKRLQQLPDNSFLLYLKDLPEDSLTQLLHQFLSDKPDKTVDPNDPNNSNSGYTLQATSALSKSSFVTYSTSNNYFFPLSYTSISRRHNKPWGPFQEPSYPLFSSYFIKQLVHVSDLPTRDPKLYTPEFLREVLSVSFGVPFDSVLSSSLNRARLFSWFYPPVLEAFEALTRTTYYQQLSHTEQTLIASELFRLYKPLKRNSYLPSPLLVDTPCSIYNKTENYIEANNVDFLTSPFRTPQLFLDLKHPVLVDDPALNPEVSRCMLTPDILLNPPLDGFSSNCLTLKLGQYDYTSAKSLWCARACVLLRDLRDPHGSQDSSNPSCSCLIVTLPLLVPLSIAVTEPRIPSVVQHTVDSRQNSGTTPKAIKPAINALTNNAQANTKLYLFTGDISEEKIRQTFSNTPEYTGNCHDGAYSPHSLFADDLQSLNDQGHTQSPTTPSIPCYIPAVQALHKYASCEYRTLSPVSLLPESYDPHTLIVHKVSAAEVIRPPDYAHISRNFCGYAFRSDKDRLVTPWLPFRGSLFDTFVVNPYSLATTTQENYPNVGLLPQITDVTNCLNTESKKLNTSYVEHMLPVVAHAMGETAPTSLVLDNFYHYNGDTLDDLSPLFVSIGKEVSSFLYLLPERPVSLSDKPFATSPDPQLIVPVPPRQTPHASYVPNIIITTTPPTESSPTAALQPLLERTLDLIPDGHGLGFHSMHQLYCLRDSLFYHALSCYTGVSALLHVRSSFVLLFHWLLGRNPSRESLYELPPEFPFIGITLHKGFVKNIKPAPDVITKNFSGSLDAPLLDCLFFGLFSFPSEQEITKTNRIYNTQQQNDLHDDLNNDSTLFTSQNQNRWHTDNLRHHRHQEAVKPILTNGRRFRCHEHNPDNGGRKTWRISRIPVYLRKIYR